MTHFSRLVLNNWRQFRAVDLDFQRQTTILTGSNGCGKTSILTVLGHHFGWHLNFVSTPFVSRRTRKKLYSEFLRRRSELGFEHSAFVPEDFDEEVHETNSEETVGFVAYSNGHKCQLSTPAKVSENPLYQLKYSAVSPITGLYIPSHRPAASYQAVAEIPTKPKTNAQQYEEYQQLLMQMFSGGRAHNPGAVAKKSLIALAVFGYGNEAVIENSEYRELFEAFQGTLRVLLPPKLGFRKLEIRMPDVVLVTDSGDFALDAMSGGINALFTVAWQIQMFGWEKDSCTVLIDEPENHLHPSMQRSLMPALASAFPRHRFIVATHSPFVVTSNPEANVFALTHGPDKKIASEHLETSDLAGTPDKVLREILEVPSTIPIWAEKALKAALAEFEGRSSDPVAMKDLFEKLKSLGLSGAASNLP